MHKLIILRALRETQATKRFEKLTPPLRNAILGALSEFETILSTRVEKKLPTETAMVDLGGVLSIIFAVETLGEPSDSLPMVEAIQRQVARAKESLKEALKPSKDPGNMSGW